MEARRTVLINETQGMPSENRHPPRYRRMRKDDRREFILARATELIARAGYEGSTLQDFADAAEMTKAGLIHHFASRQLLLVAVLERRDLLDASAALIDDTTSIADPTAARALMDKVVGLNLRQKQIIRLYTVMSAEALNPEHPAHDYFVTRQSQAMRVVASKLLSWHPDPEGAAVELMCFLDGLQLNWLRDPGLDLPARWSSFADRFFVA